MVGLAAGVVELPLPVASLLSPDPLRGRARLGLVLGAGFLAGLGVRRLTLLVGLAAGVVELLLPGASLLSPGPLLGRARLGQRALQSRHLPAQSLGGGCCLLVTQAVSLLPLVRLRYQRAGRRR